MGARHLVGAVCLLLAATPAAAQLRVQGPRPVDPRLRNQRTVAAPAASPAPAGRAATDADITAADDGDAAPTQASAPGGTLRRPSYLGGGDPAASSGPSALDLMKQCFEGSISGSISNPACVGYMAGFVGAIRISAGVGEGFPICLPETGLTNEAIVGDVSAYLEQNPESLQKSARSVVFLVLSKTHPCKGS